MVVDEAVERFLFKDVSECTYGWAGNGELESVVSNIFHVVYFGWVICVILNWRG